MNKARNIITWIITLMLALMFIGAGFAKVSMMQDMVQSFTLFGLPVWFMYVIGSLEIIGGLMLLVPATTGTAAFGLTIIMVGAIGCHLMFTPASQGIPAFMALTMLIYLALTRKNIVPNFLQKYLVN